MVQNTSGYNPEYSFILLLVTLPHERIERSLIYIVIASIFRSSSRAVLITFTATAATKTTSHRYMPF